MKLAHLNFILKSKRDKIKNRNSKAWRRRNKRISLLFRKMGTRTKMYLHTLANKILADHEAVSHFMVGDWDKRKILADSKNKFVNKSINRAVQKNNPLGILFNILKYKVKRLGQVAQKFDEQETRASSILLQTSSKRGSRGHASKILTTECFRLQTREEVTAKLYHRKLKTLVQTLATYYYQLKSPTSRKSKSA